MSEVMAQVLSGPHAGIYMYEADDYVVALKLLVHFVRCR
jgi:hypothetical protein